MKRFVAVLTVLAFTMPAVVLCGCDTESTEEGSSVSDNESASESPSSVTEVSTEQTTEETTTETSPSSEETSSDADETEETFVTLENIYVSDIGAEYADLVSDGGTFHVPCIELESEDAGYINEEIRGIMESDEMSAEWFGRSEYNVYITDTNLMTVVFCLCGWYDDNVYYMWTINLDTGERLSNREIADAAGIDDIRAAAVYALDRYFELFNRMSQGGTETPPDFIGGELNPEGPNYRFYSEEGAVYEAAINTYSEDTLNDDMTIGLDADSRLIFSSDVVSLGGAVSYNQCYSSEGETIEFNMN